jgi:hypothetical protein
MVFSLYNLTISEALREEKRNRMGWAGLRKKDGVRPAPYRCSKTDESASPIKVYAVRIPF